MPLPNYPFPSGSLFWRTRHIFTGDTTPPTRTGSVPSASTRVPFLETAPSGDGGGAHQSDARAIGMGEEARSSVFNRPLYALACALDMLVEKDNAELSIQTAAGLASAGPNNLIDLAAGFAPDPLVYLGPAGTTNTGGGNPENWCSNYIKLWGEGALGPVYSPVTGDIYQVVDVFDSSATASVYVNHPTAANVFPRGTPGTLSSVVGTVVQFWTLAGGDVPPSGTAGTPQYQGFFNYSLYEKCVSTLTNPAAAFATCQTSAGALPMSYTLDRDVQALGWLVGDRVYLTHFMYAPRISMSEAYNVAGESALVYTTFASAGFPGTQRFANFVRFSDTTILPMPFEITEPAAATLGSFDYANALIRATDGALIGTIGFDFRGGSDRDIPGGGTDTDDAYSGFIHRKVMSFATPNNAEVAEDDAVSWVGSTVTLTGFPASHFYGAAPANTQIILGVDMAELTTAAGVTIGLYIIDGLGGGGQTCNIANLDGSVPVLGADNGTLRIYRPQFRTGIWDSTGTLAGVFGGTLFVGDDFDGDQYPAVGALAVGQSDILTGWSNGVIRDQVAAGTSAVTPRFRLLYTGGLYLNGANDGASQMYTEISGGTRAAPTWNGAGTSWTMDIGTALTGAAKPWTGRHMYIHSLDANAGDDSMYAQLSVTGGPAVGLGAGEHAGLWMGFPGVAYPRAATVGAGDRDAGYVFSFNNAGSMELGVGFTTDVPTMRGFTLRETPSVRNPPAMFATPARLELDGSTSYGWVTEKTFYQNVSMPDAEPPDRTVGAGRWLYISGGGIPGAVFWRATGAGYAGAAPGPWDCVIDFPFNIPDGAIVTSVDVKYYMDQAIDGVGSRVPHVEVFQVSPNWAVPAGAPAMVSMLAAGSVAGAAAAGWQVITFTPDIPANALINNNTYSYLVRVYGAYDVDAPTLNEQMVAGVRINFTCVDLLPA